MMVIFVNAIIFLFSTIDYTTDMLKMVNMSLRNLHTLLSPLLGTLLDRMNPLAQFWRVTQTCWLPWQEMVSGSRTGGRYMLMLYD